MNKVKFYKNYVFCFFSRNGGASEKDFSSLNCAFKKGDFDQNVKKNRMLASYKLNKKNIILPNQTHSNIVLKVTKNLEYKQSADAIITSRDDYLLGVLTADCAPIVVLGEKNYGIIHAGWKGLINGILENTINKLLSLGEKESNLNVFVGPHLKKKSFEIKDDFIMVLKKKIKDYEEFIIKKDNDKFFDFSGLIESKLLDLKILNYTISKEDTFSNPSKFFSHRYCCVNKIKNCGRQISLVGIKK